MQHRIILAITLMMTVALFPNMGEAAGQKIVIGIVPEINLLKQMNRHQPVCQYLGKKLGREIELKPFSSYGRVYEKMRDGEIDAGFFGSFVYAMTRRRLGIVPLARPQMRSGSSTYSGLLFVRKDSGIKAIAELKGKTIALVEPSTTGGYLAQKHALRDHGIDLEKDMKVIWKGSHEAVITSVMLQEAAVGGAKDSAVRQYSENRTFGRQIRILDRSPKQPVPENVMAVRKGMDPALRERIKETLLTMQSDPAGRSALAELGARRFIETQDADYRPLYNLIEHMKIDLTTFPYQQK